VKKIGIIQSSYIPWKGYFDIIHDVDTFVFLEDVQYTKQDWRNRNKVKVREGTGWITVPVKDSKHHMRQKLCDVVIDSGRNWQRVHFDTFRMHYSQAKHYSRYAHLLDEFYLHRRWHHLSEMNIHFTTKICEVLGIETELLSSVDHEFSGIGTDRLIEICQYFQAGCFLTGPRAREYLDEEKTADAGIEVEYKDYSGYPEYPQLFPPFDHHVTVLDLIFNCGPDAPRHIWG